MNSLLLSLHVLAAVVWVGGMFFAHQCLRPVAASQLEPPVRLTQWVGVFGRFFPWVWIAVILLPITGYTLLFNIFLSMANAPLYVHIMNGLSIIMTLIYAFVYFVPYQKLKDAVNTQDWPTGAAHLAKIRVLVGINLNLGLALIIIASGGRFFG